MREAALTTESGTLEAVPGEGVYRLIITGASAGPDGRDSAPGLSDRPRRLWPPLPAADCEELHARADMLHHEADRGLAKAEAKGSAWQDFSDQVAIALRCESMALQVEAEIAEDC